jgi:Uri superfamily endonuclease
MPKSGSSDCHCDTHLFGMHTNPLENPRFIETVQQFRIDRLEPYYQLEIAHLLHYAVDTKS